jgi:hypothetical protein
LNKLIADGAGRMTREATQPLLKTFANNIFLSISNHWSASALHQSPLTGLLCFCFQFNFKETSSMTDHVQSSTDGAVQWILANKLRAIGYTWLAGISGSLVNYRNFINCPLLLIPFIPLTTV